MISRKLLHDIITFCNSFIDIENVIYSVDKYPNFISAHISVWIIRCGLISYCVSGIDSHINSKDNFIKFKETVLKELPTYLKRAEENK